MYKCEKSLCPFWHEKLYVHFYQLVHRHVRLDHGWHLFRVWQSDCMEKQRFIGIGTSWIVLKTRQFFNLNCERIVLCYGLRLHVWDCSLALSMPFLNNLMLIILALLEMDEYNSPKSWNVHAMWIVYFFCPFFPVQESHSLNQHLDVSNKLFNDILDGKPDVS
jgi:hypothetical protein